MQANSKLLILQEFHISIHKISGSRQPGCLGRAGLSRRRPNDASSVAPVAFPPRDAAPVLYSVGVPRSLGSVTASDAIDPLPMGPSSPGQRLPPRSRRQSRRERRSPWTGKEATIVGAPSREVVAN